MSSVNRLCDKPLGVKTLLILNMNVRNWEVESRKFAYDLNRLFEQTYGGKSLTFVAQGTVYIVYRHLGEAYVLVLKKIYYSSVVGDIWKVLVPFC